MNGPFQRPEQGKAVVLITVPRATVLMFAAALILNATTTLLLATAFVTHLLGARH